MESSHVDTTKKLISAAVAAAASEPTFLAHKLNCHFGKVSRQLATAPKFAAVHTEIGSSAGCGAHTKNEKIKNKLTERRKNWQQINNAVRK